MSNAIRNWWQPEAISEAILADIDQSVLDHLKQHRIRLAAVVIAIAAVISAIAAQTVPLVWPLLWFSAVLVVQLYRCNQVFILARRDGRPSSERLAICLRAFYLTSAVFSLSAFFFPFTDDAFRFLLTLIDIGLVVGSIATLQGYPPIFFSFAIPNGVAVSIGWIISTPQHVSYWVHLVMASLTIVLLAYLLGFSRNTYRSFATSQIMYAKLEAELEKARRINQARSKVFASASHDLRQPLQSISLLSHRLSRAGVADAERQSVVATIDVCVEALSEELDMLLDISDLESGLPVNNPELVDLADLVGNLADLYAPVALAKGMEFTVENSHLAVVEADRVLLTRLLRNLIDNALKYTDQGQVKIEITQDGDKLFVDIIDTGPGISAQDQTLIFDEFYQIGNPERDRRKGLGLGLSVVNKILPLVGGKLSVDSTLHQGSRFRVQLKASEEAIVNTCESPDLFLEEGPDSTDGTELLSGRRVLLIEDHELVQKATKALLESWGAQVEVALDWAGVERLIDKSMPDVLITDLRLPSETGLEIANKLKGIDSKLPTVLISGDLSSDLALEAKEAGYRVLSKPVNVNVLFNEVASVVA